MCNFCLFLYQVTMTVAHTQPPTTTTRCHGITTRQLAVQIPRRKKSTAQNLANMCGIHRNIYNHVFEMVLFCVTFTQIVSENI